MTREESRRALLVLQHEGLGSDGETEPVNFCLRVRPPLVTEEGGMTKSQIGQAFGNDVFERSRLCREPHVHSLEVAMVTMNGIIHLIRFFDAT